MRMLPTVRRAAISSLAYSPDGKRLAEAVHGGTVRVWDVDAGRVIAGFDVPGLFPNQVRVTFSPDGHWLAAANDRAALVDLRTDNSKLAWLPGRQSSFNELAFSPDGAELVAGGDQFFRWDVATRKPLPDPLLPPVQGAGMLTWPSAAYARDGTRFAVSRRAWGAGVGGKNVNTAFVVDPATLEPVAAFDSVGTDTRRLSFNPDGTLLAAVSGPILRVYEITTGTELATLKVGNLHFMAAVFSPDGRYLATVSKDRTTRLWDTRTWGDPTIFDWEIGKLLDVTFSPDGLTAAVASDTGKILIFDVD